MKRKRVRRLMQVMGGPVYEARALFYIEDSFFSSPSLCVVCSGRFKMAYNSTQIFTNTKSNTQIKPFLNTLSIIMAIELAIAIGIIWILTSSLPSFLAIAAIVVFLEVFILVYYFQATLNSAHRLDDTGIILQVGRYFKQRIPWTYIEAIVPISKSVKSDNFLNISVLRENESFYCLGGKQTDYLIVLKTPLLVKAKSKDTSGKKGLVSEIFINLDDKDLFADNLAKYINDNSVMNNVLSVANSNNAELLTPQNKINMASRQNGTPHLELQNISYQYGHFSAVKDLNIIVQKGEIFALLGPNGAGKSTTLNMLTGILQPKTGRILLNGRDIWAKGNELLRQQISYVPDQPILYPRLTAKEHLYCSGKVLGLADDILTNRINSLLETFDLIPWQEQMIDTYSQGMQRKVSLALALLNDPDLLIVDELTNAYDAKTLAIIKKIFQERKARGKTILFSGHVMSVMEELADYIVIVQKGTCLAAGTMNELKIQYGDTDLESLFLQLTEAKIN